MKARLAAAFAAAALIVTAGCQSGDTTAANQSSTATETQSAEPTAEAVAASESESAHDDTHANAKPAKQIPLRPGERRATLEMPTEYTASAPYGKGTDDYRCFLLDPELDKPAWLTGTQVLPGNPAVVHHVILFKVQPEQVKAAEAKDELEEGEGWTCFGGTGLDRFQNVDDAAWIGAWAPGGKESVTKPGFGVRLDTGSRIVMQVHYNLLAGTEPDVSAAQLRLAPGTKPMESLSTMLMPVPVELPCRAKHSDGPLCKRADALADVKERFGSEGNTADLLYFLCGGEPKAGERQSCTRTIGQPMTIHGVAGHMHLLGREIKIEVNPGTPEARTILDIPVWDFDDQGGRPIDPVHLDAFDQVKVSCRHVQWLRDQLPSFEGQPDRYVVWGEGTTDEMCLGMLQITRP